MEGPSLNYERAGVQCAFSEKTKRIYTFGGYNWNMKNTDFLIESIGVGFEETKEAWRVENSELNVGRSEGMAVVLEVKPVLFGGLALSPTFHLRHRELMTSQF